MVNWVIVGVVLLAILVVSKMIHFRHFKHRMTAIFLILLLVFVYSTFATVIKSQNLDLKTMEGLGKAGKVYFVWLGQAFSNLKVLTGSAIKMDWAPKNITLPS